jgi:hypothetical protein
VRRVLYCRAASSVTCASGAPSVKVALTDSAEGITHPLFAGAEIEAQLRARISRDMAAGALADADVAAIMWAFSQLSPASHCMLEPLGEYALPRLAQLTSAQVCEVARLIADAGSSPRALLSTSTCARCIVPSHADKAAHSDLANAATWPLGPQGMAKRLLGAA